jgi:hypothetical protein
MPFILTYSKPNKLIPTHQYEHERRVLIYLVMLMVFYVRRSLNCVCVFYARIEITIQYDHEKLKQMNMVMKKSETTKKKISV